MASGWRPTPRRATESVPLTRCAAQLAEHRQTVTGEAARSLGPPKAPRAYPDRTIIRGCASVVHRPSGPTCAVVHYERTVSDERAAPLANRACRRRGPWCGFDTQRRGQREHECSRSARSLPASWLSWSSRGVVRSESSAVADHDCVRIARVGPPSSYSYRGRRTPTTPRVCGRRPVAMLLARIGREVVAFARATA
jgi:hypothetical protein